MKRQRFAIFSALAILAVSFCFLLTQASRHEVEGKFKATPKGESAISGPTGSPEPAQADAPPLAKIDTIYVDKNEPDAYVVENFKAEKRIVEHPTLGEVIELSYPNGVKRYEFPQ